MEFPLVRDAFLIICNWVDWPTWLKLTRASVMIRRWMRETQRYQYWLSYRVRYPKEYQRTFEQACLNGDLGMAQLLYARRSPRWHLKLRRNNDALFLEMCRRGHVEIGRWMFSLDPKINVQPENTCGFQLACDHGHFEMAKFVYQVSNNGQMRLGGICLRYHLGRIVHPLIQAGNLPFLRWFLIEATLQWDRLNVSNPRHQPNQAPYPPNVLLQLAQKHNQPQIIAWIQETYSEDLLCKKPTGGYCIWGDGNITQLDP